MNKYTYPENQQPTPQNTKLLALVGENKQVLEVGCAMGFQTRALHEIQRCQVTGIEIDPDAANYARPYCEDLIIGDIETMNVGQLLHDRQFDVITFADVLEHLKDPAAVLYKMKPLLREGAYVLASIPNIAHCSVVYEMARGRFAYRSLGLLDDTHIRFFTLQNVYQTFEKAGYLVVALDRNRLPASETEFKTNPETDEDRQFLEYIKQRNPDAETYQFVVKAIPINGTDTYQSGLIAAQEQIQLLVQDAKINEKRIRELESHLAWITKQPGYRFLSAISHMIKR
ncbi:MAG: Methyltransferase domain-containing protein [Candidatus Nitrotoga sp. MKT]|nr:MAG: Methyltransferase domain-containing protein [Candidatus Nitrotoga sp. MKT]